MGSRPLSLVASHETTTHLIITNRPRYNPSRVTVSFADLSLSLSLSPPLSISLSLSFCPVNVRALPTFSFQPKGTGCFVPCTEDPKSGPLIWNYIPLTSGNGASKLGEPRPATELARKLRWDLGKWNFLLLDGNEKLELVIFLGREVFQKFSILQRFSKQKFIPSFHFVFSPFSEASEY